MKKTPIIYLLYLVLLSSCSLFNGRAPKQDIEGDNTSWELMFKLVGGKTEVPVDKLYLNGRISTQQMWVTLANFKVEKRVIVVKYTGIGRAKAMEVCDKLEEDKQIELLSLMQIELIK